MGWSLAPLILLVSMAHPVAGICPVARNEWAEVRAGGWPWSNEERVTITTSLSPLDDVTKVLFGPISFLACTWLAA